jgi:hypothetical protein
MRYACDPCVMCKILDKLSGRELENFGQHNLLKIKEDPPLRASLISYLERETGLEPVKTPFGNYAIMEALDYDNL